MVQISISLLDEKSQRLLIAIQEIPMGSYQELAEKLHLTRQTVSNKITELRKNNYFYDIRAVLSNEALELNLIDVQLEIPNLNNIKIIEKFSDEHLYTAYRARTFGKYTGLYLQFRLPKRSIEFLLKSFQEFQKLSIISHFELHITSNKAFYSNPQLKYWDSKRFDWNYDWNSWNSVNPSDIKLNLQYKNTKDSIVKRLDNIDAHLLYWLTRNARVNQTTIRSSLIDLKLGNIPPQRLSERWNILKEEAVDTYKIDLDWKTVRIYNAILFRIRCSPKIIDWAYYNLTNSQTQPPFITRFRPTQDGFLFFILCPPSNFSFITDLLWEKVEAIEVNLLDFKHSLSYYFDYSALTTDGWKTNEQDVHLKPFQKVLQLNK